MSAVRRRRRAIISFTASAYLTYYERAVGTAEFLGKKVSRLRRRLAADTITNVISRVTGGTSAFTLQKSSLIDGPLNSSIPGANFWFINPNGIIFGSNAVLPTTGSFHASTADYIKLSDGNIFAATPSSNEVLTVAPPSAFGFLSANPAGIQVGNV